MLAAAAGLAGLALTDHDTLAGWEEAGEACARHGVELVPGVELSTEVDGHSVHLLGLWPDPDDRALTAELARLRTERARRAAAMLDKLAALGIPIALEQVQAVAGDAPIGRPHIAAAMVAVGAVADVPAAFDSYLHDGGPAYEPKHALDPAHGVELVHAAGGVAVLAHPGLLGDTTTGISDEVFTALVEAGLDGVEADHPGHLPEVAQRWRDLAAANDLVVTGASDFHGERKHVSIGTRVTTAQALETLRSRAARAPYHNGRKAPRGG